MFDLFLALLLARSVGAAAWRRFWPGVLGSGGATVVWGLLAASGWVGRGADSGHLSSAALLALLGPSALPGVTARVPWSAVGAAHPVLAKVLLAALLVGPFVIAWRRADRCHSPLSDEHAALKGHAMVYLLPALLVLGQVVCLALGDAAFG